MCYHNPLADRDAHYIKRCSIAQNDHNNLWEDGGLLINTNDSTISWPSAETSGFYALIHIHCFGTITSHSAELHNTSNPKVSALISYLTSHKTYVSTFTCVDFILAVGFHMQNKWLNQSKLSAKRLNQEQGGKDTHICLRVAVGPTFTFPEHTDTYLFYCISQCDSIVFIAKCLA